jgi:bacteriocin biosynthesis cyclodehydratase domain-containing protein
VRPALKPGLLPVWRDRDTVQIGIDPRRAVALTGMRQAAWVISLLDGSRDRAQVIAAASERGIPARTADRIIALLAAGGALDDFPASTLGALPAPLRATLAAELATSSLACGDSDGGARALARRRAAQVRVYGAGRIGPAIVSILSTAGVGLVAVAVADKPLPPDKTIRPAKTTRPDNTTGPGQTAPPGDTARPGRALLPDLAIVTGHQPPELTISLMKDRTPHLAASAGEAIGVVGPLVLPGRTACLRCLDYTRTDGDPAWPLILAQLSGKQADPAACDAPLVAAVAAQAAAQALAAIDRTALAEATINGTLELFLPGWQWRRRTWPPHPACGCGSYPSGGGQWEP